MPSYAAAVTLRSPLLACIALVCVAAVAGGCARNAAARNGVTKVSAVPDELRGVWDGVISLSARTAQTQHARLILGKESALIVRDNGTVRLIPREEELAPEHFLSTHRRATVTFAPRPMEGRLSLWRVRVESPRLDKNGKRLSGVVLRFEYEPPPPNTGARYGTGGGGEMQQPVPLAEAYGRGPRSPYFRYADWRSADPSAVSAAAPAPAAGSAAGGVRARVKRLADQLSSYGKWKCLAGQTLTVVPGKVYEWEKTGNEWVGDRLYAFCAHEDDDLAIRVGKKPGGVPFHILRPGPALDYPALVLDPYLAGWSRPAFYFQHYWDDPATALDAESRAKPIKVTLLVFGRSFGDQGPGFDFNSLPQ